MNGEHYLTWCETVLRSLVDLASVSPQLRTYGADEYEIGRQIFSEEVVHGWPGYHGSPQRRSLLSALRELTAISLLEDKQSGRYRPTPRGERHSTDRAELYSAICEIDLKDEQVAVLTAVNRLSPQGSSEYPDVTSIAQDQMLEALGWTDRFDLLNAVGGELERMELVRKRSMPGPSLKLTATYAGLAWELRRQFSAESKHIDHLVREWETTNVDFKREISTKTKDEKAGFVKDVISLANTQTSGRRWIVIGFDDETRGYFRPPDPSVRQEHFEQLLATYSTPMVRIKYEIVHYSAGEVGLLEILREAHQLPYRVAKSVGDKKRISEGDVFVRHGSISERPSVAECEAIEHEGTGARERLERS